MEIRPQNVAVVGAGIAGLVAANELTKKGFQVTVFERNSYVGGRIKTEAHNGHNIESGAQSYFEFYRLTRKLIDDLDLARHETYLSDSLGILRHQRIFDISLGPAFLFANHISFRSKLLLGRLLGRLLRHWSRLDHEDLYEAHHLDTKSVAQYAAQELNEEILEYLFEPILSGIFYWPAKEVSQAALFVLLRQALFGLRPMTLKCGLSSLPNAMAQSLDVRVNNRVTQITITESGGYKVVVHDGSQTLEHKFDAVVCATTATAIPRLLPFLSSTQKAFFQKIEYSQNVNVAMEVENDQAPEKYSFYVPLADRCIQNLGAVARQSGPVISLFSSAKSGASLVGETDRIVATRLVQDLQKVTGTPGQIALRPLSRRIYRWQEALPILDVGYFKRLKEFRAGKIESGNLVFCGDYLGGAYIEGAVRSGMKAANRLTSRLRLSY